jgi:hypothetical protein
MSIIYKIVMGTFFKRILKSLVYQPKGDYELLWEIETNVCCRLVKKNKGLVSIY